MLSQSSVESPQCLDSPERDQSGSDGDFHDQRQGLTASGEGMMNVLMRAMKLLSNGCCNVCCGGWLMWCERLMLWFVREGGRGTGFVGPCSDTFAA